MDYTHHHSVSKEPGAMWRLFFYADNSKRSVPRPEEQSLAMVDSSGDVFFYHSAHQRPTIAQTDEPDQAADDIYTYDGEKGRQPIQCIVCPSSGNSDTLAGNHTGDADRAAWKNMTDGNLGGSVQEIDVRGEVVIAYGRATIGHERYEPYPEKHSDGANSNSAATSVANRTREYAGAKGELPLPNGDFDLPGWESWQRVKHDPFLAGETLHGLLSGRRGFGRAEGAICSYRPQTLSCVEPAN